MAGFRSDPELATVSHPRRVRAVCKYIYGEDLPKEGLEPSHCCQYGILNPARLPIPPLRRPSSGVASPERLEPCLSDLDSSISPPTNAASRDPAGGTRSVASRIDPNGGTRWCENPFSHRWCGGIVSPAGARIPSRTNVVAAGARIPSRTGGVGESFPPPATGATKAIPRRRPAGGVTKVWRRKGVVTVASVFCRPFGAGRDGAGLDQGLAPLATDRGPFGADASPRSAGARIPSRTGGVGESFPPPATGATKAIPRGVATERERRRQFHGGGPRGHVHEGVATEGGGDGCVRALSPLRGWSRRRGT